MAYIYLITNMLNGKRYVGETKQHDYKKRWAKHKSIDGGCPILHKAFKKYGVHNFTFKILVICFDDNRFSIEKEYIQKYNTVAPNGYNLKEGNDTGMSHTDESRAKISDSLKKYFQTEEGKAREHVNITNHRKCMAEAVGKKIGQYDLNGKFIASFVSISEAARQVRSIKSKTSICKCIDSPSRTGLGYVWKTIE